MTKEEIIILLEKKFVENYNVVKRAVEIHDYEKVSCFGYFIHSIAEIIAIINDTSTIHEIDRIFNKYKLNKGE